MQRYLKYILPFWFIATHLVNLTLLPIFTDETNYLDWGWREIHIPGYLFYSLYDAKQPLVMWLFGIFQSFISNPLFAGRLVSVLMGLVTATAIYFLGKKMFDKKIGVGSFILYSLHHYFFLFDRQALVESGLTAIIAWTGYVLFTKPKFTFQKAIILGLLFGLGYLTKSNSLLVIIASMAVLVIMHKKEIVEDFGQSILKFSTIFITGILINLPMLTNPWFGKYIHLSTQYTFSFGELIKFPINKWLINISATSSILFWLITPIVLFAIIAGVIKSKKYLLVLWVAIPLLMQIFMARFLVSRYLVSYLPLLLIYAVYFVQKQKKIWKYILVASIAIPLIYLDFLQVFQPQNYFYTLAKVTKYSYIEGYVTKEASGYNTEVARKYFADLSQNGPYLLGLALFSGNPEASLLVYFRNDPKVTVTYLDVALFGDKLKDVDCLKYSKPVYLASRDKNGSGLDKYFEPVTQIRNSYSDAVLYVFKLKENCQGKSYNL